MEEQITEKLPANFDEKSVKISGKCEKSLKCKSSQRLFILKFEKSENAQNPIDL